MKAALLLLLLLAMPVSAQEPRCVWPAWERYKAAMMTEDGRIIDHSSPRAITTSEGQSYAMFFALVADDRHSFRRLLDWTINNLAGGDLSRRLPAWLWGRDEAGRWRVLDDNNASDSDLWIAYNLLEAGRLWQEPEYSRLGTELLWRSAAQSLRMLPGLGLALLPGTLGFESAEGWRLNPSYLPPQLLQRFAAQSRIWEELAETSRRLLLEGAPRGLAPDWLRWQAGAGVAEAADLAVGSYDAVRVYLWLGMLDERTRGASELLAHFTPMLEHTAATGWPPERVDRLSGRASGTGPAGFSAALLPMLSRDGRFESVLQRQLERLRTAPPEADAYYNQSLLLFGLGWYQGRYRFDQEGRLQPAWDSLCEK